MSSREEILSRVNEIAVLPHVVYKILEISGSADAPATELERAIVVDPGFSAKLLAHANCAFYGLPKRVTSIKDGIMFLGFKAIRQMAMTVGIFDLFAGKTDRESLRRREWWRTSIDSAVVSKWLASEKRLANPDEVFTIGLLHLIGKTILDRSESGKYDGVEDLIESGATVLEAEREIYDCDHIDIAMGAAARWGLPNIITQSFDYLSAPEPGCEFVKTRAILAFSRDVASVARLGSSPEPPAWCLEALGLAEGSEHALSEQACTYLSDAGSMMS
ncbi:MAG: HDOD domain-containing protein [Fimbriimonadaceae bacterium]